MIVTFVNSNFDDILFQIRPVIRNNAICQAKLKRQGITCDHVIITAVDTETFNCKKRDRYHKRIR
jgi:hypothetical protein